MRIHRLKQKKKEEGKYIEKLDRDINKGETPNATLTAQKIKSILKRAKAKPSKVTKLPKSKAILRNQSSKIDIQEEKKSLEKREKAQYRTQQASTGITDESDPISDKHTIQIQNPEDCTIYENKIPQPSITNPQEVYRLEILDYFKKTESNYKIKSRFIPMYELMTCSPRWDMVQWLISLHIRTRLSANTIFLTVYIIDKILSMHNFSLDQYKCLKITSLYVAAKYQELKTIKLQIFLQKINFEIPRSEVFKMEARILTALEFKLGYMTPIPFIEETVRINGLTEKMKCMAITVAEMSLLQAQPQSFKPSEIAAASLKIARTYLSQHEQDFDLDLQVNEECRKAILDTLSKAYFIKAPHLFYTLFQRQEMKLEGLSLRSEVEQQKQTRKS